MNQLDNFESKLNDISGVGSTRMLHDVHDAPILQVNFFGSPHDYSQVISGLKEEHNIKTVDAPQGSETKTPDGMPIIYFTER